MVLFSKAATVRDSQLFEKKVREKLANIQRIAKNDAVRKDAARNDAARYEADEFSDGKLSWSEEPYQHCWYMSWRSNPEFVKNRDAWSTEQHH
jgi:hypothetical protein